MRVRSLAWVAGAFIVTALLLAPTPVFAQGTIAGVARDATGGVLPGVTVEAASPALIEKVRTVITDGEGVFRIVDLRPGTYSVTFTLAGFNTFRREGVLLEGSAVATVNGDMRVGALEENITVTGEAPIVDTQSTVKEQVLSRELLDTIPTGRQVWTVGYTLPGVTLNGTDVGGTGGIQQERMGVHGAGQNETTIEIDGMIVNTNHGNGSTQQYFNDEMVQEMAFQTASNSAETQRGGVRLNMIPQTGGNRFAGSTVFSAVPGDGWQSDNITDALQKAGLGTSGKTVHLHDYSGQIGGPILRDRVWFFTSVRHVASNVATPDVFNPDGSQVVSDDWILQGSGRVTWQASTQNKISGYYERSKKYKGNTGGKGTDLLAMTRRPAEGRYYDIGQVKWTSTVSAKLLLENGWAVSAQNWTEECQKGVNQERGTPAWFSKASRQDIILGTRWTACASNSLTKHARHTVSSSVGFITGSHALKTGVQWGFGPREAGRTANGDLVQRYRNGVADSVIVYNTPNSAKVYLDADLGVYAQDAWKRGKATFNYGVRWDYFNSHVPAQNVVGGRFFTPRQFAAITLPTWSVISPRFGVAYDLFGDGKTAVKLGVNKYVNSEAADFALQYNPAVNATDTRTWNDLNVDDIAQDNEIGPSNNLLFGIAPERSPDPNLKRPYNIEYSASIERQLLTGLSASIGYYRRTYHRLYAQDNILIGPTDYTPVNIVSPLNNESITVYNLNRAKQGLSSVVDRQQPQLRQIYNGVEATFQVRTPGNGRILGGLTHDRTRQNTCSVDDPNASGGRFCDEFALPETLPFRNLFKLTGFYPLPLGIEMSGSLQSAPGGRLPVTYSVGRTIIPALTQTSVNVPLVQPGSKYLGQINQLDFSLGKSIRLGAQRRVRLSLDMFNTLNSNVILSEITTYGPSLGQPQEIIEGRLFRIGAQFHF